MVGLAHLVIDKQSKKDQGLSGILRRPSGWKRVVRSNVDWLVPFSPSLSGNLQFAAVALVAGLPVLSLAFFAAVLHNFASATLLQDGWGWLDPVISTTVGAFVQHYCWVRSSTGSHAGGTVSEKRTWERGYISNAHLVIYFVMYACFGTHGECFERAIVTPNSIAEPKAVLSPLFNDEESSLVASNLFCLALQSSAHSDGAQQAGHGEIHFSKQTVPRITRTL